ncbi:MAG: M42 family metallopeptidase [Clostridiaceae bacterium]|jgi:putative aminopeptidase FrvX|nr:M42 family metallopeptidase [Clostridiaceae bacterium]
MNAAERLRALMLLPAPSGYEQAVARYMRDALKPLAAEVTIDRPGNVLARFPGQDPAAPVTMVFAHMDQLGFVVRTIDRNGFLRLERLGGVPEKVLPGLAIQVLGQDGTWIPGLIGNKSHHVTPAEEKYRAEPIASLYADIGARSEEEAQQLGVQIGAPAVYKPACRTLAGGRISGTAVDNRGGCAALLLLAESLARQPAPGTVWLAATVWEEFNLRGAALAARSIRPDAAIGLDVVLTGDTPDMAGTFNTALGQGPAVMLYNFHGRGTLNGTIPHPGLVKRAEQAAAAEQLTLQRFAGVGILTDTAYVQLEGEGPAALELAFPARYTHTPVETCDPSDIDQLARLLHRLLCGLDSGFDAHRY